MKTKILAIGALLAGVVAMSIYSGCKPEKVSTGNGLTTDNLAANFTVTPIPNKPNYYALKAAEVPGVLGYKWNLGDGGGSAAGKAIDTVFYPDAGAYTITLTTIGKGGGSASSTQNISVATSDPNAGNLVQGGKMQAGDDAKWTHLQISPGVTMAINNGYMWASGGNGGHAAIYQAINVVAGKKYKVDMLVQGSGATDTWFEVYADFAVPVQGQDYPSSNKLISLNTWAGCGKGQFSGKLSAISCSGSGNTFTFTKSGTVYLLIKSGGSNLGTTGIGFTNVEFRGVN
ncbi:hypothetical protein C8P68_102789 [Mucilaginibacter yixingensis]|uniref:PKD domain-containing protein n=1 Tax=Mucilaginibacter yixingensis TaxID=1295612 RepID=A0A2T5JDX3_9SPHI|nr:PKD domain-containing protein [Mucilaginibacter yixingensis]PTQ99958.1 hypothetical protein C8P68_102789 [Mucilaginibacter yixingensis]